MLASLGADVGRAVMRGMHFAKSRKVVNLRYIVANILCVEVVTYFMIVFGVVELE